MEKWHNYTIMGDMWSRNLNFGEQKEMCFRVLLLYLHLPTTAINDKNVKIWTTKRSVLRRWRRWLTVA